jgi:hypothetical protein
MSSLGRLLLETSSFGDTGGMGLTRDYYYHHCIRYHFTCDELDYYQTIRDMSF